MEINGWFGEWLHLFAQVMRVGCAAYMLLVGFGKAKMPSPQTLAVLLAIALLG